MDFPLYLTARPFIQTGSDASKSPTLRLSGDRGATLPQTCRGYLSTTSLTSNEKQCPEVNIYFVSIVEQRQQQQ